VDGFSVSEIAEMLGIKPSTTSMRIARARERLRRLLGEDDEST
jgi:DNA-directed RNA polymerase specialized sigma24 family protein